MKNIIIDSAQVGLEVNLLISPIGVLLLLSEYDPNLLVQFIPFGVVLELSVQPSIDEEVSILRNYDWIKGITGLLLAHCPVLLLNELLLAEHQILNKEEQVLGLQVLLVLDALFVHQLELLFVHSFVKVFINLPDHKVQFLLGSVLKPKLPQNSF